MTFGRQETRFASVGIPSELAALGYTDSPASQPVLQAAWKL